MNAPPRLRPSLLDPLFAPASGLPGVGPKLAPLLEKLLGTEERPARVADLLFHLPQRGVSRPLCGSIRDAPVGEPVTLAVQVVAHRPPAAGRVTMSPCSSIQASSRRARPAERLP